MDLTLIRGTFIEQGIYGELFNTTDQSFLACTLEHAYEIGFGSSLFCPKLPAGEYICIRHAPNRFPYETFEVQNVPGHTGILFHIGNWNKDSDGCILLGESCSSIDDEPCLLHSKRAFGAFMALLDGETQFTLTVKDS